MTKSKPQKKVEAAETKKMSKVFSTLKKDQPEYAKPSNKTLAKTMKRITTTELER